MAPLEGNDITVSPLLASLARKRGRTETAADEKCEISAPKVAVREHALVADPLKKKGKKKKNAPVEISSRKPFLPQTKLKRNTRRSRDPRFDDLSGKLDLDLFQKSYTFLDEYREEEAATLKKQLQQVQKKQKRKNSYDLHDRAQELRTELRKQAVQDKQRKQRGALREAELELRREERLKVAETGKTPYFHKRGTVRNTLRSRKGSTNDEDGETKVKGGRDRLSERREKKLAAREKRKLPSRRSVGDS